MFCVKYIYRICREFEAIKERALKIPETTEEMIETILYVKNVKTKGIQDLLLRIKVKDSFNSASFTKHTHLDK